MRDLFDYRNQPAAALDPITGGVFGIRLPEAGINALTAMEYAKSVDSKAAGRNGISVQ